MRSGHLRSRALPLRRFGRAAAVLVAGVVALVAAGGFGTPALRPLGVALVVLGAGAILLVELVARGLRIARRVDRDTAVAGQPIVASVRLSGWAARTGALHLLDWRAHAGAPRGVGEQARSPARRGETTVQQIVLGGLPRGEHVLGPPWIALSDPFGLVRVRRAVRATTTLLVLPRTVPVALPFWEGASRRMGEVAGIVRGRVELAGIRDYEPGDPMSLIHWSQTARRGRLQTKDLHGEAGRGRRVVVVLDAAPALTEGDDGAAFETAVSAAASLVAGCVSRGTAVGLEHAADPPASWPLGSEAGLIERDLALVRANAATPVSGLIRTIAGRADAPDTLVVVTANADPRLSTAASAARSMGVTCAAVLVGPARSAATGLRRSGAIVAEVADPAHLAASLDLMSAHG